MPVDAEVRSTRQSPTKIANLQQPKKHPVRTINQKRKASDVPRITRAIVKKKRRQGPSGHSPSNVCAKCGVTSDTRGVSLHRIPPYPANLPANVSKERILTHRGKRELRAEAMDRIGRGRDDRQENLRVCSRHVFDKFSRVLSVSYNGSLVSQKYALTVVSGAGVKSSIVPSESTKGVGTDRYRQNQLNFLKHESQKLSSPHTLPATDESELEKLKREKREAEGEAAAAKLVVQQFVECNSVDNQQSTVPICPSVSEAAGFVKSNEPSNLHPHQMKKFKMEKGGKSSTSNKGMETPRKKYNLTSNKPPAVLPTLTANEVKRRTGFKDATHIIAYIITVCNGDVNRIRQRKSPLTWFEEWFLYFEWKWHQTNRRQIDIEYVWGIGHHQINDVKDCKAALEMAALLSWPRFASYDEDYTLRERHNPEKWRRYNGYRPIQWDNTNVSAVQFSDASLQRATYSDYYGENCFKAGCGIQLCGFGLNDNLWGGGVSDTDYNKNAGYLQAQHKFAETDLVNGQVIKFHNILDRGYRGSMAAWQNGQQVALQPPSAKSDERFKGKQTIYAGCIARDRSGNERCVNVCKRAGLFSRGFRQGMSAKRFNYAWRTWGFQANFMYKPVL